MRIAIILVVLWCATVAAAPVPPPPMPDPFGFPALGVEEEIDAMPGVVLARVRLDSPLGKAGAQAKDRIVAINGQVVWSFSGMLHILKMYRPGAKVEVEVTRNNLPVILKVTLALSTVHE